MRRLLAVFFLLALVAAACGSGDDTEPSTNPAGSLTTTSGPGTTIGTDEAEPTTTTGATTPASSDRPLAPDFTLELGEGGSYTLSEASKPVYLVFWAEW